jgi:SAM-dependent methyltransferase
MVERARERVRREGLEDRVQIHQGDMMDLPFDDGRFDAVMAESVVAFAPDKARALDEFARVLKPGGYVAFTEATWNREPSPETLARVPAIFGEYFSTFPVDGWRALVVGAGFEDVVAEAHPVSIKREAQGRMERIGCRNMLGTLRNFVVMMVKKPQIRSLYGGVLKEPQEIVGALDYGIYAGRKPE